MTDPSKLSETATSSDSEDSSAVNKNGTDSKEAYFYVVFLGVGYYFPFEAISAVSDYWDKLFPGENILFLATAVFFVVNMLFMLNMSRYNDMDFNKYTWFGFGGQLLCMIIFACLNWFGLDETGNKVVVLLATAWCGITTAALDCAMLGLVSQYNVFIQEALEVGIGVSGVVGMGYRVITKLVWGDDVTTSSQVYFAVVAVTIVLCMICYYKLARLPSSAHIFAPENKAALAAEAEKVCKKKVLKDVWMNQLCTCLQFTLYALVFPALITNIEPRTLTDLGPNGWFTLILLTLFCVFYFFAVFMPARIQFGLTWKTAYVLVIIRFVFTAYVYLIGWNVITVDWLTIISISLFGLMTGYCTAFSIIVTNQVPTLSHADKRWTGKITAMAINGGLCFGSVISFLAYAGSGH